MDLDSLLANYADVFRRMEQVVTRERALRYCTTLSETPAPSGTVRFTRARVLQRLLRDDDLLQTMRVDLNYRESGNMTLRLGPAPAKPVWAVAHLDQCSYLVERPDGDDYRLLANCYHMIRAGAVPAHAVAVAPDGAHVLAEGELRTGDGGDRLLFTPGAPTLLERGSRVMVTPRTRLLEDGGLTGSLDDAFGCAALALAAAAIAPYEPNALFAFTDEEEGPVSNANLTFARGSARLVHRVPSAQLPRLAIVVDSHEAEDMADGPGPSTLRPGDGASFGEAASRARGGITQPVLYGFLRDMAASLEPHGIHLRENRDGYVSRSDCVPLMLATPNLALVGYLLSHRHFDGLPRAHPDDLVHLARAVAVLVLVAQSARWRACYLDGEEEAEWRPNAHSS
jgi:hypothetical protein